MIEPPARRWAANPPATREPLVWRLDRQGCVLARARRVGPAGPDGGPRASRGCGRPPGRADPALAGTGDHTIAPDNGLAPAPMEKLVEAARQRANTSLTHGAGAPQLKYDSIGSTCGADWNSPTGWRTRDQPKIVYLKGEAIGTTDSALMDLRITGNSSGAGILIIEGWELVLGGNFRWEGVIIVAGKNVGLKYAGGGEQTVYGGIIVNQTENRQESLADINGWA